jgi:predicted acetyltransferase
VIRSANAETFKEAGHLVANVFSGDNPRMYERMSHDWIANLPTKPNFSYNLCRVGMVDEQVVSQVLIEKDTLYYGKTQLKVAMIGKVVTHPQHRHLGYSSALIRDTLTTVAEQGAHLALLNDLGSFYHRFGFSTVLPDTVMEVDSEAAMQMPRPLRIRTATVEDLPYIAKLYKRHWGGRVSFRRSIHWWEWKFNASIDPVLVAVTQGDQVQGYLWRETMGNQLEIVCDTLPATMSLLSFLGKRMNNIHEPLIQLVIPPDDTILSFVRQMMSVNVRAIYQYNSGWMARIIDSTALLNALLPEITSHARAIIPKFNSQALYLTSDVDAVTIGLQTHPDSGLHLSHRDFIQVMFGSLQPTMLARRDQLPHEMVQLLQVLFPPRIASIAPLNWM